jgi:hypothetical protein
VRIDVDEGATGRVAAAEAEQIQDNDAMPFWESRYHVAPQVARRRKPVYEDDWLACAPRTGGVVVEP